MKKIIFITIVSMCLLNFLGCKKELSVNYKPEPSPFSAQIENSSAIPAAGGDANIIIQAGTDGWWVEIPDDSKWISVSRKYGSGDFKLSVQISSNTTGDERTGEIILHPTFDLDPVSIVISQGR